MHLVGFIIRIFHDARSPERHNLPHSVQAVAFIRNLFTFFKSPFLISILISIFYLHFNHNF